MLFNTIFVDLLADKVGKRVGVFVHVRSEAVDAGTCVLESALLSKSQHLDGGYFRSGYSYWIALVRVILNC